MQTQVNWIKYEGNPKHLREGEYLVYGLFVEEGKAGPKKVVQQATFFKDKKWHVLDSFIIEYITPLSEIERGLEEAVAQK